MHCITVKKKKLIKYRISWLPRLKTDGDYFVITYYRAFIYIVRLVMFSWCEKCNYKHKKLQNKGNFISFVSSLGGHWGENVLNFLFCPRTLFSCQQPVGQRSPNSFLFPRRYILFYGQFTDPENIRVILDVHVAVVL